MQKFLTEKEIRDLIINDFRSRGEYVDNIKFDTICGHFVGYCVSTIPNPYCTHRLYNYDSAIKEVVGKMICIICGSEFSKKDIKGDKL